MARNKPSTSTVAASSARRGGRKYQSNASMITTPTGSAYKTPATRATASTARRKSRPRSTAGTCDLAAVLTRAATTNAATPTRTARTISTQNRPRRHCDHEVTLTTCLVDFGQPSGACKARHDPSLSPQALARNGEGWALDFPERRLPGALTVHGGLRGAAPARPGVPAILPATALVDNAKHDEQRQDRLLRPEGNGGSAVMTGPRVA